jgi:hypothetical protein
VLPLSFSNRYSVRPLPSTRIDPSLLLAAATDATPDARPAVGDALPEPYPPEPDDEPDEPELLPHPAASVPAAASTASAASGRRMDPDLRRRNRDPGGLAEPCRGCAGRPASSPGSSTTRWSSSKPLVTDHTLAIVLPFHGPTWAPAASLSRATASCWHADEPAVTATMPRQRSRGIAASPQARTRPAGVPACPLAAVGGSGRTLLDRESLDADAAGMSRLARADLAP